LRKEPVGSKAPSVTGDAKRWLRTKSTAGFAMQCQAQGHPVPAFRYLERDCALYWFVRNENSWC